MLLTFMFQRAQLFTATMLEWSRTNVLALYKLLLRNGERLKFTDKDFYLRRIRNEFEENRNVESSSERLRLLQVSP